jgi:hypothetical protein
LFSLLQLWESPTILNGMRSIWKKQGKQSNQQSGLSKEQIEQQQLTFEMLPTWPHGAQVVVDGQGFSAWGTLAQDGLVTTAADIALKHAYEIPGIWHVLGILDALPSELPTPFVIPQNVQLQEIAMQNIRSIAKNLAAAVRTALGRPVDKYGITPLLVFREVSG